MEEGDELMTLYRVTTELKTPWWKKILRFFRIVKKQEYFDILFNHNCFKKGEILEAGLGSSVKVISKTEYVGGYDPHK